MWDSRINELYTNTSVTMTEYNVFTELFKKNYFV